jgi:hypothetical protein
MIEMQSFKTFEKDMGYSIDSPPYLGDDSTIAFSISGEFSPEKAFYPQFFAGYPQF